VAVVLVLVVASRFVAEPLRVTSVSMEPTLRAGDQLLVDKVFYRFASPRRNDLIIFPQPGNGQLVVKRIVGLPGDAVALEDGVLTVNGHPRHEPYVDQRTVDSVYFGPETVPDDKVFVMGDNRGDSIDSRSYGPVEVEAIVGRVLWRIWPPGPRRSP
jgi:signal peptidase I